ncbi:MAG: Cytochrome C biosis protein [Gammaproteobacteria bacterium]|nr:Cytochrome C biosis protein [Gammaproteobacteria bacterium]
MLIILLPAQAADIPLEFDTPEQQQRYQHLIEELRCLVCQNQNLADSHADLAQDLREEVYEMVQDGKANEDIVGFLVARYGDFVLYRPPVKLSTWLLWFAPFILLLTGIFVVFRFARARMQVPPQQLSAAEQSQLTQLLKEENKD